MFLRKTFVLHISKNSFFFFFKLFYVPPVSLKTHILKTCSQRVHSTTGVHRLQKTLNKHFSFSVSSAIQGQTEALPGLPQNKKQMKMERGRCPRSVHPHTIKSEELLPKSHY